MTLVKLKNESPAVRVSAWRGFELWRWLKDDLAPIDLLSPYEADAIAAVGVDRGSAVQANPIVDNSLI